MNKLKRQEWVVIHYGGSDALVSLDPDRPDRFYWSGGPSWAVFREDTRIVKEYGWFTDGDPEIDQIELDFYQNFNVPRPAPPHQSPGWLAPDGKFYPCAWYEHDGYARRLAAIYYSSLDSTRELERRGWLRILTGGVVGNIDHDAGVTQAQYDALFDMTQSFTREPDFRDRLKDTMKFLKVSDGPR